MNLDNIKLGDLTPFEANPRHINAQKLASLKHSMISLGLFKPILVWRSGDGENIIIGGNQRYKAMTDLQGGERPDGCVEANYQRLMSQLADGVPCIQFEGSRDEARVVALRDNNSDGDWDWEALTMYVANLDALNVDLTLSGFDDGLLADLRDLASSVDAGLDRYTSTLDDLPDGETEPVIVDDVDDDDDDDDEGDDGLSEGRKIARFTVGNLRGQISVDDYKRFLSVWQDHAVQTKSTDIPTIFGSILSVLEKSKQQHDLRDLEMNLLSQLTTMDLGDDSAIVRQSIKLAIERIGAQ